MDNDTMGNNVSGGGASKEAAAVDTTTIKEPAGIESPLPDDHSNVVPDADPDFADELAELEKSGGDSEDVLDLEFDSELPETPVKKDTEVVGDRIGEVVSSEEEDEFSDNNKASNRLSTESITSNEELLGVKSGLPGTPCQDERNQTKEESVNVDKVKRTLLPPTTSNCEPLSDSDKELDDKEDSNTSVKLRLSDPDGLRIHIGSIEEELDDIESEEGNYSDKEAVEKKREKKGGDMPVDAVKDTESGEKLILFANSIHKA